MEMRLKRFLSLVLAMVMVIGMMPTNTVFAEGNPETGGGEGQVEETTEPTTEPEETTEPTTEPEETTEPTTEPEETTEPTTEPEETTEPTTEPEETTEPTTEPEETTEPTTEPEETTEPTTEPEEQEPVAVGPVINTVTMQSAPNVDLPDNEELFAFFAERELYDYEAATFGTTARTGLTATEQAIYDALKVKIESIAVNGGSTEVVLSEVSGLKITWTNTDLGVTSIEEKDLDIIDVEFGSQFNFTNIVTALLYDCPFDLYWYDKTVGVKMGYQIRTTGIDYGTHTIWDTATVSDLTFIFAVSSDYMSGENNVTSDVTRVSTAKNEAAQVVAENAGKSDYEKFVAYKTYICDAVTYDHAAADYEDTPYGDPWQLISVFDGNDSTNVVCEGYSKAFQYLCDLDGLNCISVSGVMGGGTGAGNHMWNVVTLEGAKYLVDVTNSDTDSVGQDGGLFLVGAAYEEGGYHFTCGSQTVTFTCDDLGLSTSSYTYQPPVTTYTVTVSACENGTVTAAPTSAEAGTEIQLTVTPATDYVLDTLTVTWGDNQAVEVTDNKFTMPACDVTVVATFKKVISGTCGENLTWELDENGVLTISGSGEMQNYSGSIRAPWYSIRSEIKSVVIENGVTSIGDTAFPECTNLTGVTIPESVTDIGEDIFSGCSSLTSVTIPEGVTRINTNVFSGCSSLTSVTIPNSVTSIESGAFEGCTGLTSIAIPEGVTVIGGYAFSGCTGLTSITIPDSMIAVAPNAFNHCSSLTEVVLGEALTTIEYNTFSNCTALQNIVIPENISNIKENAFAASALSQITFKGNAPTFAEDAFKDVTATAYYPFGNTTWTSTVLNNYGGEITWVPSGSIQGTCGQNLAWILTSDGTLTISGTGSMYDYSWSGGPWPGYDSVKSVIIEEGVTIIGECAFYKLSELESVSIPSTVTQIDEYAFGECFSLTSVVIPANVTYLSSHAFGYCDALTDIVFLHTAEDPISLSSYAFRTTVDTTTWDTTEKTLTTVYLPYYPRTVNQNIYTYFNSTVTASRITNWANYYTVPVEGIALSAADEVTERELGETFTITANLTPVYPTEDIIWTVSDPEMGLFSIDGDNATFIGQKTGTVTVRCASADDETVYGEIELTVLEPTGELTALTSLRVMGDFPNEIELDVPAQMVVEFEPANAANRDVTWEVDDGTGSATIDENGIITPLTPGTVIVTATSKENPDLFATCTVEILRYVDDITILLDGKENVSAIGVGDSIRLSALIAPTDAKYQDRDIVWTLSGKGGSSVGEVGTITAEQLQIREGAGTAYASAGSYKKGDVVVVLEQQTVSGTTWGRTNRGWISMSYVDLTGSTGGSAGVASLTKKQSYYYDDNGSSHSYYIYYLNGVSAGAVTLTATSPDSRGCFASIDLYVVGQEQAYAVSGGNIYYNTTTGVITRADSTVTEAVIPSRIGSTTITGIAPEAFIVKDNWGYTEANTNLTYVKLPDTVTFIGDRAFSSCTSLATLKLGNGLTTIGVGAFSNCDSIVNLTIPDSVTSIGSSAFYDLDSLKNLTMSGEWNTSGWLRYSGTLNNLTLTGTYVRSQRYNVSGDSYDSFYYGRGAKNVIISDSVTCIDKYAFESCRYMESISIGSGVTSIGDYAFQSCYSLTTVNLPEGLQSIGEGAFSDCHSLTTINLPDSLQTIGKYAFSSCEKLQLIDLSAVPDVIMQKETKLNNLANVPSILISATGGKTELYWRTETVEGEANAYVYGHGNSNDQYLHAQSTGRVLLVCVDEYTGARGSKEISVETGIELRGVPGYLTSGKYATVKSYRMPDNTLESVSWELRTGAEYAALNTTYGSSVKVTAKTVDRPVQVQLAAIPNGGDTRTADIWILPKTTGISLFEGKADDETGDQVLVGQTGMTVQTVPVDMFVRNTYSLNAKMEPVGALEEVAWKSSNTKIATVDNGTVTMKKTGTVTITATAKDGSGKSASVKLKVSYLDTASKLTATAEVPAIGLQGGFTTTMLVYGSDKDNALDPRNLTFTIPESQQAIATVDASGVITAGEKPGTVTVTAAIDGDPLNRKVTLKVKVIATQTESLKLVSDEGGEEQTVYLDKKDMSAAYTFTVRAEAVNVLGNASQTGLKWTTTDSRIATVKANGDGSATVKVKAKVDGVCVISAVTTDYAKVESDLTIVVRDYAPRLESTSLKINTNLITGVSVPLLESYDNSIDGVTLHEYDSASRTYLDTESERLEASYEDDLLTITHLDSIKNGTVKLQLRAATSKGVYTYNISLKVANSLPSITVKQPVKFNLNIAQPIMLTLTAKNAVISDVVLDPDTSANFQQVEFDRQTGLLTLVVPDDYIYGSKVDAKVEVDIYLEGYSNPVRKAVTVGTSTAKPAITIKQSGKLNLFYTDSEVQLLVTAKDMDISHVEFDGASTASFCEVSSFEPETGLMTIGLTQEYLDKEVKLDTSAKLLVYPEGGGDPIAKTFTVRTTTAKPSLALTPASSIINIAIDTQDRSTVFSIYNKSTGEILELDSGDVTVTAAFAETPVLEGNSIKLTLAGTSGGTATVFVQLHNWAQAIKLTHKVTVQTALPVPVLGVSTLQMNRLFPEITAQTTVKLNQNNHQIDSVTFVSAGKTQAIRNEAEKISLNYKDGVITAAIDEGNLPANGTYEFRYTIKLADGITYLPAKSIKVKIHSVAPAVSISAKGTLDTMNPDSAINYTVNKLTNIPGTITDVALEGEDKDRFCVVLDDSGTKPVAKLTMADRSELATNKTYKLKLVFTVQMETENGIVTYDVASNISFKVKQSTLKFIAIPVVRLYQFRNSVSCTVELSTPVTASLAEISLNSKTSSAFLRAMGGGTIEVVPAGDGRSAEVCFRITKPGYLVYGKSYTVYLDVTPANNATNAKPVQVKVTVKTYK